MIKNKGTGKKKPENPIDEVEELLKLTQEDLLLKLTVNSHLKTKPNSNFLPESSSSSINPDLDRRFEALRSKPAKPNPRKDTTQMGNYGNKDGGDHVDDLFARFAALKGVGVGASNETRVEGVDDVENDEEYEVERIISWAVDAARLDPSPLSDVEGGEVDESDDSEEDSDEEEEEVERKVERKKKGVKKGAEKRL